MRLFKKILRSLLMISFLVLAFIPLLIIVQDYIDRSISAPKEVIGVFLILAILSLGNVFFHTSYLRYVEGKVKKQSNKRAIKLIFWISNVILSLGILVLSIFMFSAFLEGDIKKKQFLYLFLNAIIFILGFGGLIDLFFVKRNLNRLKTNEVIEIDKIGQDY